MALWVSSSAFDILAAASSVFVPLLMFSAAATISLLDPMAFTMDSCSVIPSWTMSERSLAMDEARSLDKTSITDCAFQDENIPTVTNGMSTMPIPPTIIL